MGNFHIIGTMQWGCFFYERGMGLFCLTGLKHSLKSPGCNDPSSRYILEPRSSHWILFIFWSSHWCWDCWAGNGGMIHSYEHSHPSNPQRSAPVSQANVVEEMPQNPSEHRRTSPSGVAELEGLPSSGPTRCLAFPNWRYQLGVSINESTPKFKMDLL